MGGDGLQGQIWGTGRESRPNHGVSRLPGLKIALFRAIINLAVHFDSPYRTPTRRGCPLDKKAIEPGIQKLVAMTTVEQGEARWFNTQGSKREPDSRAKTPLGASWTFNIATTRCTMPDKDKAFCT